MTDAYGGVHGALSHLEQGNHEPRLLVVVAMAGILEITVDNLLAGDLPGDVPQVKDRYDLPALDRQSIAEVTSDALRNLRSASGLSPAALAAAAGTSLRTVRHLEGARPGSLPSLSAWLAIAGALDIRPSDLLCGIRYVPAQGQRRESGRRRRVVFPRRKGLYIREPGKR